MTPHELSPPKALSQVAAKCAFADVSLAGDAGYVQATRTTGALPSAAREI